ncbi:MAG: nucleoside triphosphate pyrophosphohydrolase [Firmicutes bacterium]|nr:nucleoside triphosphate pyrophosphohydrolase [Bacillota bacterium]
MIDFEYREKYGVQDFIRLIAVLRGEGGCPWDREQTHESIRRNLLEETYEVCEAIDERDSEHLKEELGDLLMQVIFHAQIETERGCFTIADVADAACRKLITRHPHVFGDVPVSGADEVLSNWDDIKRRERAQVKTSSAMDTVARSLPALWRAEKLQEKAKKAGFDWPDIAGPLAKLEEEKAELLEAIAEDDQAGAFEELGDILFSVVNAARFLKIDPEDALNACCEKFIRRYRAMEELAEEQGVALSALDLASQEALYQQGKTKFW